MSKLTVAFSMDDEIDRDIVAFFATLPRREKSRTFRAMARAYIERLDDSMPVGLALGDLYQMLVEIRRLLKQGVYPMTDDADSAADQEGSPQKDPLLAHVEDALSGLGL
jgi:hypothetical protein